MIKKIQVTLVLFILMIFSGTCLAQDADNTKANKRDKSQKEMTADQQGESKQDREITKKIRRAIVKDKSLSTKAHNVKVITKRGMVTLKGPVNTEDEKNIIEQKAAQIAGSDKIKSEIEIAPSEQAPNKQ
ncbi:MAG: BON domain-containing protein [Smithella sp.]